MGSTSKLPVYFIGFGDFALEILADWHGFNLSETHDFVGFFDDDDGKSNQFTYLGLAKEAHQLPAGTAVILTAALPSFRKKWMIDMPNHLFFPNLIHLRSRLGDDVVLGKGNIISEGCILTTAIVLGDFNVFNHYVTVGHHCQIGDGNALMTKAHLSGRCSLGNFNLMGVGSSVLQGKSLGHENILAAHACLMHHASNQQRLVGVPALGQSID